MPSPSTILTSGCVSVVVIAGLTFLADVSTRAQLDHALENVRASRAPVATMAFNINPTQSSQRSRQKSPRSHGADGGPATR